MSTYAPKLPKLPNPKKPSSAPSEWEMLAVRLVVCLMLGPACALATWDSLAALLA